MESLTEYIAKLPVVTLDELPYPKDLKGNYMVIYPGGTVRDSKRRFDTFLKRCEELGYSWIRCPATEYLLEKEVTRITLEPGGGLMYGRGYCPSEWGTEYRLSLSASTQTSRPQQVASDLCPEGCEVEGEWANSAMKCPKCWKVW